MKHLIYSALFLFCFLFSESAQSQSKQFAIGWRFGWTEGITARAKLNESTAIEGIFGFRRGGYSTTFLFEKHKSTNYPGLNYFYGAGIHFGRIGNRYYYPYYKDNRRYSYYYGYRHWGPDLILGLEFVIPKTPIALSLDIKPSLNFYDNGYTEIYPDPGLGLKVIF
jgi:hypothetical protein